MKQNELFDLSEFEQWREEWQDMPEFVQEDQMPYKTINVHFKNRADMDAFAKLLNCKLTDTSKYIWYPLIKINNTIDYRYDDES